MPPKIRELVRDLKRADLEDRGGKGSHRNFKHPKGMRVNLSGNDNDDANPYQEKEVKASIEESRK